MFYKAGYIIGRSFAAAFADGGFGLMLMVVVFTTLILQ